MGEPQGWVSKTVASSGVQQPFLTTAVTEEFRYRQQKVCATPPEPATSVFTSVGRFQDVQGLAAMSIEVFQPCFGLADSEGRSNSIPRSRSCGDQIHEAFRHLGHHAACEEILPHPIRRPVRVERITPLPMAENDGQTTYFSGSNHSANAKFDRSTFGAYARTFRLK